MQPGRRALVQWLAASMALAATGCSRPPRDRIYSYARLPEIAAQGAGLYYASACLRGGYAQGVLVGTQQGRPIKVEGNPQHPASLGGTDVFAQAAILQLWDPDRSTAVWRRADDGRRTPSTWASFEAAWRGRPRAALHLLVPPFTSPTLAAQLAALLQAYPGSRWYRDEGAVEVAAARGAELAFGRVLRPVHRFDRATLIVALGGDPFSDAAAGVRQSADWAAARAEALAAGRAPARLLALETTPGLFGARADERWALAPPALEAVLWRSAAAFVPDLPQPVRTQAPAEIATRLAELLAAHRGSALLVGGPELTAESHALVHLLNQRLGAFAACATLIESPDVHAGVLPAAGALAELAQAAQAGAVHTLVVLGANPVYGAPAALKFAAALEHVPFSVHFGGARDETAERCRWHLPCGHAFEQWSDARAFDGSATLLQPAIAPLYDTRSPHELLALLGAEPDADRDGHALVQRHWRSQAHADGFASFWRESLRSGCVADSASAPLRVPDVPLPSSAPAFAPLPAGALWAVFPPDASVGHGEHANNGWLQELPRSFTKISWGNALCIGPRTARALGLASGDVVRAQGVAANEGVEVPVWVQPGHAEGAASLAGGGGRTAAGRVGNGVGVDNAALRSAAGAVVALELQRLRGGHRFALSQIERDPHGRKLARVLPFAAIHVKVPDTVQPTLYSPTAAADGPSWGMAIDLDACIGCNVCTIACQAENNIPVVGPDEVRLGRAMHWIRVDTWQDQADRVSTHDDYRVVWQPVPCMHCENAPCELVCPVGATMHDSEGLNVQVYNRCIGTRFCSNNCPYKVRRFNFRQYSDVTTETAKLMHNPDVTVRDRGVMEKCTYCVQRLSRARRANQTSGEPLPRDTVQTACQSACPTRAIHFGDLRDAQSDVVHAKASPRHYAMLGELGTRPRTTYLARIGPLMKEEA